MSKFILVTDPTASPAYLANRFSEAGYQLIVLQTLPESARWPSYKNMPFYKVVISSGNIEEDANNILALANNNLLGGFYGVSATIDYADQLLNRLFPNAANSCDNTYLRNNKYEMTKKLNTILKKEIEQVRLPYQSEKKYLINKTIDFFTKHNKNIVIKPSAGSALSIGVCIPKSNSDIIDYYNNQFTPLFFPSDFLVQEKLSGRQLYVNTASHQGKHIIAEAGAYEKEFLKKEQHCLYDDPIDISSKEYQELFEFSYKVLTLLEMNYGFSHIEIAETENGYALIELNPRYGGASGFLSKMAKALNGIDQIDAYISLLERKDINIVSTPNIFQRLVMIRHCTAKQYQLITNLKSHAKCTLTNTTPSNEELADDTSIKGLLLLSANSKNTIISDYEILLTQGMVKP